MSPSISPKKTASPREQAIKNLLQIIEHKHSLSDLSFSTPYIQEICYGTIRWYYYLDAILNNSLKQPLKKADTDIYLLLLISLYELVYLQTPEYASVNEAVNTAQNLKKPWAKKLINAILRNFLRNKKAILELINNNNNNLAVKFSHPDWLYQQIKKYWPEYINNILNSNNTYPPFTLRINKLYLQRENYLPGINHPYNQSGITLEKAQDVKLLPGFLEGKISVQDGAAQLAADLMQLQPNQTILDACAAPGGKTAHLLETEPNIKLTALDISETRLKKIAENIQRLRLPTIKLIKGDATKPKTWWDGQQLFDRILVDAPCSATGVIRRHPDIKLLRRESDIPKLAKKQLEILNNLWPLLKPNGLLVYATCSILPQENTAIIQQFLQQNPDAKESLINTPWGLPQEHGRQILPGMDNMDGFYYARLEKIAKIG